MACLHDDPIGRRRAPRLQGCDVEDLAQDVLLALHAARASYEPGRPFLPWLLAITKYRSTDGLRRLGRRGRNEVTTDTVPETFSPPDANLSGEGYGDADALELALVGLPAGQRTAVELTKLRELSLAEAAAASGMSQGAIKVAVHRGIAALRKALVGRD